MSEMKLQSGVYGGSLFSYTAGICCGVLIKEHVMQKLAKLQAKHLHEVKQLLANEAEKGAVFPSMWTLHYPNGKQTTIHYIDTSRTVDDAIRTATIGNRPIHHDLVLIANSMDEAKSIAGEQEEAA